MVLIGKPEKVEIPHAPGNFVHLRLLSGVDMMDARRSAVRQAMEMTKLTQGITFSPEQVAAAREARGADSSVNALVPDCDPMVLVDKGCVDWEGPAFMDGERKVACTGLSKREQLDEQTFSWLATEILRRNRRPPANGSESLPP